MFAPHQPERKGDSTPPSTAPSFSATLNRIVHKQYKREHKPVYKHLLSPAQCSIFLVRRKKAVNGMVRRK